jgi:hypothetical protein
MPSSPVLPALLTCCCLALFAAQGAAACNPAPPRPPILEGHAYDAVAAEYLVRDATSVVAARLSLVLDLEGGPADTPRRDYAFEVVEGWGAETPRRLIIGGHFVDCAIEPRAGRAFLLYLDGERLLYALPVERLDLELALLGEPGWFYDVRGQLVRVAEG